MPGLTIQGGDAFLQADFSTIDLMGGELRLEDGAVGVVTAPGNCGGIVVRNQARLMLMDGMELNQGSEISVSEGANMNCLQWMKLNQNRAALNDGILCFCGGMEMAGCTVDVGQDSNFGELLINSGDALIDKDTTINIYGSGGMAAGGNNINLGGKIVNNGRMELRDNITISGYLVNQGTLNFGGGSGLRIPVT